MKFKQSGQITGTSTSYIDRYQDKVNISVILKHFKIFLQRWSSKRPTSRLQSNRLFIG